MSLDGVRWKEFTLGGLFHFGRGKVIDADSVDRVSGSTAYITRTERNNGVNGFIDFDDASYLNTKYPVITIGNETAEPFVHTYPFYTGTNINILSPKTSASRQALIFVSVCFKLHKSKYSYGYAASSTRLKNQRIQLPVDDNGQPDYDFMERYIYSHEQRLIRAYVEQISARVCGSELLTLGGLTWKKFLISDVAEIVSGRDIYDDERIAGQIPYIGSSALNNGITHFISNTNETQESDCISVNRNGSVGYAFYHPYEALYSNDCRKLRPKIRDKYAALFIARQITSQKDKYSYGYKMGTARLMRQEIMLPVDKNGLPDWQFMHNFMKAIENHQLSQVLKHFTQKLRRA